MNLRFYYEQIVREYQEEGISVLISLGYQHALKRFVKIFPTTAKYIIPRLSSVDIEPTNVCNLRCKICYAQRPVLYSPRKKGFLDFKLYKKIIDELSTFGYTINLGLNFGGESLLHDGFIDIMDYAVSKGVFRIQFVTNGTLLSDAVIEALIDLKIDNVTISLDGLDEVHESIKIGSDYNVIKNNILKLVKKRGSKSKPKIGVNLVECEQAPNDVLDFINFWVNTVDYIVISPYLSEDLRIIKPTFFDEALTKENNFCSSPFRYLAILWNGDVTTCCHDINGVNILGNVVKQSIADVWKSKKFRDLRYAAVRNTFSPQSLCYKCNAWKKVFSPYSIHRGEIKITYSSLCKLITGDEYDGESEFQRL
jgi:radical SAM protein with 4Fe4S-binding SPASM domain